VNEAIAVAASVAAAITFGASDVIEQRATHTVPERRPLDFRLFLDLLSIRLWLIGITVDITASALHDVPARGPTAGGHGHRLADDPAASRSRRSGSHRPLPRRGAP
jgi:hypothetical protein